MTEQEFRSQDGVSAGTGAAAIAGGRNQAPDEPKTMGGGTAAGFCAGWSEGRHCLTETRLYKGLQRNRSHVFNIQEYKSNAGILPT